MQYSKDFKFQYLFSVNIACLIIRIVVNLQFNEKIGPTVKIVGKMTNDFMSYIILYMLLALMFALILNINFMELDEFGSFFDSFMSVIDASLGNYAFTTFDKVNPTE